LHHTKNGESPQQVQPEDAFAVNIDVPEVLHSLMDAFQI
jgi:hypothetical protein